MSWLWQDLRAMYPKSPANRRWRIHHVNILPGRGPFRCTNSSNHARRADLVTIQLSQGLAHGRQEELGIASALRIAADGLLRSAAPLGTTQKTASVCWPFLRGCELSADYSARSFRRRSSSSASWWRLTLPDSVKGMASMNSMCSGRKRLATPMESRYSAMESSVGVTSPVCTMKVQIRRRE